MRRHAAVAATLGTLVVVTACTGHRAQPAPTRTSPAPATTPALKQQGTLHGRLILSAGLHAPFAVPGTVTVTGIARRTITVGADGRYAATLAPGVYQLTGRSPKFNSNGADCIVGHAVTVTPGSSSQADVICMGK
jgi:hypothetical protein